MPSAAVLDRAGYPGSGEHLARPDQLLAKRRLTITRHRLAHLAQRTAGDLLRILDLVRGLLWFVWQESPRQLVLKRDQRQAMAKQVVQVARKAQPLLRDRASSKFHARRAQPRSAMAAVSASSAAAIASSPNDGPQ